MNRLGALLGCCAALTVCISHAARAQANTSAFVVAACGTAPTGFGPNGASPFLAGYWYPQLEDVNGNRCVSGSLSLAGTTSNASDGVATSSTNLPTVSYNFGFNGTTWDRLQVDGNKLLKVVPAAPVGYAAQTNTPAVTVTSSSTSVVSARTGAAGTGRGLLILVNTTANPAWCTSGTATVGSGTYLAGTVGASINLQFTGAESCIAVSTSAVVSVTEIY